jgi:hydroxyacylglutathione hydrolase
MTLRSTPHAERGTPEVDVAETARAWTDRSVQLVDVRESDEWDEGHIPGAIHIPLGDLVSREDELMKEVPVIVVCRSGVRSLFGTEELMARGFPEVANFKGGMLAWAKAGHPVE